MTEVQKSFKKKLENSGLHIEEIGGVPILKDGKGRVISGGGGSATWGSIGGLLNDQTDLKNALNAKADATTVIDKISKLGQVPGASSGTKYRFPFNIFPPVQSADKISATFQTLIIDDNVSGGDYTIEIPGADVANNKAGLYTKELADAKSKVRVSATGTATDVVQYITVDGVEKKLPSGGSGSVAWGGIIGDIDDQADLSNALDDKVDVTDIVTAWSVTTTNNNVPSEKLVKDSLDLKATQADLTALTNRVSTNEGNITLNAQNIALNTAAIATKQKQITYGTADPSGGSDGDIYIKYTA